MNTCVPQIYLQVTGQSIKKTEGMGHPQHLPVDNGICHFEYLQISQSVGFDMGWPRLDLDQI